jgi:hypothetical protein
METACSYRLLEEFFAINAHQGTTQTSDVPTGLRHALLRPHGHRVAPANQDIFQVTFVPWSDLCVRQCWLTALPQMR